jgi:hypothetical protein
VKTIAYVAGYQTSDGQFWPESQKEAAEAHQKDLNFRTWCYDNICRGGEWTADMVAAEILQYWRVEPK